MKNPGNPGKLSQSPEILDQLLTSNLKVDQPEYEEKTQVYRAKVDISNGTSFLDLE